MRRARLLRFCHYYAADAMPTPAMMMLPFRYYEMIRLLPMLLFRHDMPRFRHMLLHAAERMALPPCVPYENTRMIGTRMSVMYPNNGIRHALSLFTITLDITLIYCCRHAI